MTCIYVLQKVLAYDFHIQVPDHMYQPRMSVYWSRTPHIGRRLGTCIRSNIHIQAQDPTHVSTQGSTYMFNPIHVSVQDSYIGPRPHTCISPRLQIQVQDPTHVSAQDSIYRSKTPHIYQPKTPYIDPDSTCASGLHVSQCCVSIHTLLHQ